MSALFVFLHANLKNEQEHKSRVQQILVSYDSVREEMGQVKRSLHTLLHLRSPISSHVPVPQFPPNFNRVRRLRESYENARLDPRQNQERWCNSEKTEVTSQSADCKNRCEKVQVSRDDDRKS